MGPRSRNFNPVFSCGLIRTMKTCHINEEFLTDIVIVSNTPAYLFRRFRRDPSVQGLGQQLSEFQLAEAASYFGTRAEKSFLDRVYVYAHLIALSFKHVQAIKEAIRQHLLPPIEWGTELLRLVMSEAFSETRTFVSFRMEPVILSGPKNDIPTNIGSFSAVNPPSVKTPVPISGAQHTRKVIQIA
jgi:hypothetical protein